MAIVFRLGEIIEDKNITPADLMAATKLSRNTVKALVGGINTRVDFPTLDALCKALDVTPGDLIKYIPDED